jgi:peroxiredoxin
MFKRLTIAIAAPDIGALAPDFTAADINGNEFKLSDYKDKTVVLEWTNHQCPYVMKHYETGNMQKTQAAAKEHGVEWVSIVSSAEGRQGNTTAEEAKAILEQQGAIVTTKILDPSGTIGGLYDAKTTPHMYIIDAEGMLVYAGAIDSNPRWFKGSVKSAKNYILAALDNIAAGEPIETQSTRAYGCSVKYAY